MCHRMYCVVKQNQTHQEALDKPSRILLTIKHNTLQNVVALPRDSSSISVNSLTSLPLLQSIKDVVIHALVSDVLNGDLYVATNKGVYHVDAITKHTRLCINRYVSSLMWDAIEQSLLVTDPATYRVLRLPPCARCVSDSPPSSA